MLHLSLLTKERIGLVLPTPALSAGNPGAASRLASLLGLRRIAFLQESGRHGRVPRMVAISGGHFFEVSTLERKAPTRYFGLTKTGKDR